VGCGIEVWVLMHSAVVMRGSGREMLYQELVWRFGIRFSAMTWIQRLNTAGSCHDFLIPGFLSESHENATRAG